MTYEIRTTDSIERRGEWMRSYHGGLWHSAVYHETYGRVSGKVFGAFHKAACNGSSLYSPWGRPLVRAQPPDGERVCARCRAIADKEAHALRV